MDFVTNLFRKVVDKNSHMSGKQNEPTATSNTNTVLNTSSEMMEIDNSILKPSSIGTDNTKPSEQQQIVHSEVEQREYKPPRLSVITNFDPLANDDDDDASFSDSFFDQLLVQKPSVEIKNSANKDTIDILNLESTFCENQPLNTIDNTNIDIHNMFGDAPNIPEVIVDKSGLDAKNSNFPLDIIDVQNFDDYPAVSSELNFVSTSNENIIDTYNSSFSCQDVEMEDDFPEVTFVDSDSNFQNKNQICETNGNIKNSISSNNTFFSSTIQKHDGNSNTTIILSTDLDKDMINKNYLATDNDEIMLSPIVKVDTSTQACLKSESDITLCMTESELIEICDKTLKNYNINDSLSLVTNDTSDDQQNTIIVSNVTQEIDIQKPVTEVLYQSTSPTFRISEKYNMDSLNLTYLDQNQYNVSSTIEKYEDVSLPVNKITDHTESDNKNNYDLSPTSAMLQNKNINGDMISLSPIILNDSETEHEIQSKEHMNYDSNRAVSPPLEKYVEIDILGSKITNIDTRLPGNNLPESDICTESEINNVANKDLNRAVSIPIIYKKVHIEQIPLNTNYDIEKDVIESTDFELETNKHINLNPPDSSTVETTAVDSIQFIGDYNKKFTENDVSRKIETVTANPLTEISVNTVLPVVDKSIQLGSTNTYSVLEKSEDISSNFTQNIEENINLPSSFSSVDTEYSALNETVLINIADKKLVDISGQSENMISPKNISKDLTVTDTCSNTLNDFMNNTQHCSKENNIAKEELNMFEKEERKCNNEQREDDLAITATLNNLSTKDDVNIAESLIQNIKEKIEDNSSAIEIKCNELNLKVSNLTEKLYVSKKQIAMLESDLAESKRREDDLIKMVASYRDIKQRMPSPKTDTTELFNLRKKTEELSQENVSLKNQVSQLSSIKQIMENSVNLVASESEQAKKESNQAQMHLANAESAFSDVHQKYENCKIQVELLKKTEASLRRDIAMNEEANQRQETKYINMKAYAMEQVEKYNHEIITMKKHYESELTKVTAQMKRYEIKSNSLMHALEQKTRECEELAAAYDDMIGKV